MHRDFVVVGVFLKDARWHCWFRLYFEQLGFIKLIVQLRKGYVKYYLNLTTSTF